MHCGKKRGTHLTRNLQNSESHFSLTRDTEARNMFYSALTEFLTCLLTLVKGRRVGAGGQYIFQYLDHFYFFYMIILFYSFFFLFYMCIRVHFCPEFFPNQRAQGSYELSGLLFFQMNILNSTKIFRLKSPERKIFPVTGEGRRILRRKSNEGRIQKIINNIYTNVFYS